MVEMPPTESLEIRDLYSEEISARCHISNLYAALLLLQQEPGLKLACAAHDWSLISIKGITEDLITRIPKGIDPTNGYSKYFKTTGKEVIKILSELKNAIDHHTSITIKIEQFGKGIL